MKSNVRGLKRNGLYTEANEAVVAIKTVAAAANA